MATSRPLAPDPSTQDRYTSTQLPPLKLPRKTTMSIRPTATLLPSKRTVIQATTKPRQYHHDNTNTRTAGPPKYFTGNSTAVLEKGPHPSTSQDHHHRTTNNLIRGRSTMAPSAMEHDLTPSQHYKNIISPRTHLRPQETLPQLKSTSKAHHLTSNHHDKNIPSPCTHLRPQETQSYKRNAASSPTPTPHQPFHKNNQKNYQSNRKRNSMKSSSTPQSLQEQLQRFCNKHAIRLSFTTDFLPQQTSLAYFMTTNTRPRLSDIERFCKNNAVNLTINQYTEITTSENTTKSSPTSIISFPTFDESELAPNFLTPPNLSPTHNNNKLTTTSKNPPSFRQQQQPTTKLFTDNGAAGPSLSLRPGKSAAPTQPNKQNQIHPRNKPSTVHPLSIRQLQNTTTQLITDNGAEGPCPRLRPGKSATTPPSIRQHSTNYGAAGHSPCSCNKPPITQSTKYLFLPPGQPPSKQSIQHLIINRQQQPQPISLHINLQPPPSQPCPAYKIHRDPVVGLLSQPRIIPNPEIKPLHRRDISCINDFPT